MQVENQTRRDIDGKKVQLRQTVGQSYHELITSADMIKKMSDECKNVVDDLASIRGVFADLAKALTTTRATPAAQQQGMSDAQLELYGTQLLV
jgi:Vps51/Vps67